MATQDTAKEAGKETNETTDTPEEAAAPVQEVLDQDLIVMNPGDVQVAHEALEERETRTGVGVMVCAH